MNGVVLCNAAPATSLRSSARAVAPRRAVGVLGRVTNGPLPVGNRHVVTFAGENDGPSTSGAPAGKPEEKELFGGFGYTRLDAIILGVALIALGYIMYYGLQALGMDAGMAGNWVQLVIFLGICIGWVSTYLYRVATKNMTYVRQLEAYEEAVMQKRLEEMPEAELEALMKEIEKEKQDLQDRRKGA